RRIAIEREWDRGDSSVRLPGSFSSAESHRRHGVTVSGSIRAALPESTSSSPLTIEARSGSFPPDPSSSGGRQQEEGVQDSEEVVMAEALLCTRLSRYGPVSTLYASGELDIASGPVREHAVLLALY